MYIAKWKIRIRSLPSGYETQEASDIVYGRCKTQAIEEARKKGQTFMRRFDATSCRLVGLLQDGTNIPLHTLRA